MNRRRLLSLAGYTGVGLGAFAVGLSLQRLDLFHSHDEPEPDQHDDFVMPPTVDPFEFPDIDGQPRALSEWENKFVLLNFWATWCGPCREEIPLLIDVQARFDNKLQVVGLALDRAEPTRLFGDEYGINYPSLIPGQDEGFALLEQYQPRAMLPFSLLIDPKLNIISSKLGAYNADDLIDELTRVVS